MPEPIEAVHRLRLSQADAHYGGGLVAGARLLELFGDVATELCIRSDGDEGLFAGYSDVQLLAPVRAGDFVEVRGSIVRAGQTSREMSFEAVRYAVARPDVSDSAADLLAEPEPVARATGTCVVKDDRQRGVI
ncbi:MAG: hotdog fold domain-containing protein [Actinomycetota bacterium]